VRWCLGFTERPARRGARTAPRPHHSEREGQRRAGSHCDLSRSCGALRLSAAPGLDRSGHGIKKESWRRAPAWPWCCRKASVTPCGCRSRPSLGVIARRKCSSHREILQTMGLRSFTPMVVACPGCGPHHEQLFPGARAEHPIAPASPHARMAQALHGRRRDDGRCDGLRRQWPGESKHANIGVSLPGTGERPVAPVYEDGEKTVTLKVSASPRNSRSWWRLMSRASTCARKPHERSQWKSCKPCEVALRR